MNVGRVIISLTAISSRIDRLGDVITRLLNQSVKPDRIVVNVSRLPYMLDKGININDLPLNLRELAGAGLVEFYFVPNTGSYRKLLPTLKRFSDKESIVVTADDDVLYPGRWLEGLLNGFLKNECIIAYRSRVIDFNEEGGRPYDDWKMLNFDNQTQSGDGTRGLDLLPTGRGGILYHSSFFPNLGILNDLIKEAPKQDDIAFRLYTLARSIEVCNLPIAHSGSAQAEFAGFRTDSSLYADNAKQRGEDWSSNDRAIRAVSLALIKAGLQTDLLKRLANKRLT